MRFALYSDLHLEIKAWEPPALDVDLVVLAGDIGIQTRGLTWAAEAFQQPVIYVAGNHEYYGAQLGYPGERTRIQYGMLFDTGFRNDLVVEP